MTSTSRLALVVLAVLAAAPLGAQTVSPALKAALADPGRPARDSARDSARHPGEMLALAGIKPGDKVADFMMGAGYWTRILAKAVGPKGHVYAYQAAEFIGFRPVYADEQKTAVASYDNVTPLATKLGEVAFPEKLDAIVTVQNYHDLYLPFPGGGPDLPATVTKRLYEALKPGGMLLVADHVAANDPDNKAPATIHRIEPGNARKAIEKAGFVFVTQSDLLHAPADPHTANVFAPEIQGKTDQFVMVFRKP